jgi:hypothetical protein
MDQGAVPRALTYVGFLLLLCLASTFPWWAAANLARAEYRRLLSALACSMRVFSYSVFLLCLVVAAKSLHLAPRDPRSELLGWIHVGGTVAVTVPSAWRSFRAKGPRLLLLVAAGWAATAALVGLGCLDAGFRRLLAAMPRVLSAS